MKKPKKNWLEWSVFALSLVLILATAGILIHEQLSLGEKPAEPHLKLGRPVARDGYFAVPVTVVNRGDETAANVHLSVVLHLPDGPEETAEFDLPYLPRRATREAWITFRQDPRAGKLEPRVLGYQKP